jgi:hypothetical protein
VGVELYKGTKVYFEGEAVPSEPTESLGRKNFQRREEGTLIQSNDERTETEGVLPTNSDEGLIVYSMVSSVCIWKIGSHPDSLGLPRTTYLWELDGCTRF